MFLWDAFLTCKIRKSEINRCKCLNESWIIIGKKTTTTNFNLKKKFNFFVSFGFRSAYEEEILESIVIPTFMNIAGENDAKIRTSVGELLLRFVAQCDTKRSIELLDIIEKLLNRPFDRFVEENRIVLKNDDELTHIKVIVDELIRVS